MNRTQKIRRYEQRVPRVYILGHTITNWENDDSHLHVVFSGNLLYRRAKTSQFQVYN